MIAVDDFSLVEGELPSISIVPEVLSAHSNVFIGSFDTDTVLKGKSLIHQITMKKLLIKNASVFCGQ